MSKTFTRKEFDELDEAIGKYRQRKDERQGRNSYYAYKKRKAERRKMREDARWITIGAMPGDGRNMPKMKGRHVLIDDEGEVISGAGGSLTGVKLEGAESTSGDVKVDPSKTSDPKPTSPAGEAGKSSSEVAAEAEEAEKVSTGETGTEPKETKEAKKGSWDETAEWAKKALKDEVVEAWDSWLADAPVGTGVIKHTDFGDEHYYKEKDGWYYEDKKLVDDEELAFEDVDELEDYKSKGYGISLVSPETGEMITALEIGPKLKAELEKKGLMPKAEGSEPATEPKSESAEWEAKSYLDSYKDIGKTLEWVKSAPMGAAVLFTSDADDVFVIKKEADGNWYGYTSLDDDAEPVNSFKDEMAVATDLAHPDIESDTAKISVYNPKTGEIEEKILGEAPEGESAGETKGESSDDTPPWAKEFGSSISDADKFGKWAKYVPTDAEIVLKNNAGEEITKFIKDYDGWIMVVPGEPKEYLTDLGAQDWIDKKKAKVATWEVTDPITDTVAKEKFSETAEKGFADGPESETKEPEGKKTPGTMSYATEDKASSGLTRVTYGSKAYSAAARKAAIQEAGDHAGKVKVHNKLFPGMQKWWSKLDDNQKTSLRDYTGSYHDTNEPLRGFTYTSFSKGDDHIKNKIKAIDEALDKSTLEEPLVVTRGVSLGTFNAMVKHKSSEYKTSKWDVPHYGEELVGKVLTEPSYMSCTAAGEADFSSKPVQLKIYCPTGTKGAYINPISAYGMHKPHPEDMDGSEDPTEGSEFEFLLQRGCKFKVRKITEGKSGQYEVELDLIEQNPRKLSVSGKKGIYDDGKDAYDF